MSRILSLCKRSISLPGHDDHRLQDTCIGQETNLEQIHTYEVMPEASRVSSSSHLRGRTVSNRFAELIENVPK